MGAMASLIMPEDLKLFDEFAKLRAMQCVARFKTRLFMEQHKKEEFRKECRRLQFMIVDYQDKIMECNALQAYQSYGTEKEQQIQLEQLKAFKHKHQHNSSCPLTPEATTMLNAEIHRLRNVAVEKASKPSTLALVGNEEAFAELAANLRQIESVLGEYKDKEPDDCASVSLHEWQPRGLKETKRLIKWFRELDMREVTRIGCEQIDYQQIKNMKFSDLMKDSFKVD